MRKPFSTQTRLDAQTIPHVKLNLNCRDEIIPLLYGLQHIYAHPAVRDEILQLVAQDVNEHSRNDRGRAGMDYWQITVLAAARLGCNLDYDKLQDLAEQHRALRQIMGIGDWQEEIDFNWRRIRDNISLLKPTTIEAISHCIVDEAYRLEPDAMKQVRADSFVVETNLHYPTESSLLVDGLRKTIELGTALYEEYDIRGWRQHEHLLKKVKQTARQINRIAAGKGKNYQERLAKQYRKLLALTKKILSRGEQTCQTLENDFELDLPSVARIAEIRVFIQRTEQVCNTARRRVLEGEHVPNEEKLFSLFEPHTQLYRRGKAGQPNQFGRQVLIYEHAGGFLPHHHLLPRDAQDQDVVVEQTGTLQERLAGRVESISLDRGFHSPDNQAALAEIVSNVCLPKPGRKQAVEQLENAPPKFHRARRRHAGVESAIGALQAGNGLVRCRDESEVGLARYVALAILGRNLHTLGKLLIARQDASCGAASSKRTAA
jgi:hypothetical protein